MAVQKPSNQEEEYFARMEFERRRKEAEAGPVASSSAWGRTRAASCPGCSGSSGKRFEGGMTGVATKVLGWSFVAVGVIEEGTR